MSQQQPFKSAGQVAVALTTTLVSVPTALPIPGDGENILIVNATAVPIAVSFDVSAPTASVNSLYILRAGADLLITVGRGFPLFGAAMPIGTAAASVYFMRGDGCFH